MSLEPGHHLGPYEIQMRIGVGGMGEVYRATDTNLKRSVAVKVLPASVALDADRLARFQREAEVLAALNHPNIAGIYGLERAAGVTAIVMELVEGPTLADRIAGGKIPIDETLTIARQIVAALAAAHESSIVHRDLKPANIKVRTDGVVKVLDFGLAKAMEPAGAAAAAGSSMSPTITTPAMTQAGMILGTAAYMSPEQAKARSVDRRTDIWAFGCVVYEMLTGRRAFDGEDVTDTIAAVVRAEPDWNALPADTSPQIRLMLRRCLEKDWRARIADIAVAGFLLSETIESPAPAAPSPSAARTFRRGKAAAAGLGLAAGAIAAGAVAWAIRSPVDPQPAPVLRFALVPPAAHPLAITGTEHDVAISADGTFVVYRSNTAGTPGTAAQSYLVVRELNDLEVRPLPATVAARNPFFSPDGRWIGYFAGGELRKISITGGPPVTICRTFGGPRGASWGDDDTIVFASVQGGIQRVPAGGGDAKPLLALDSNELHLFPTFLPGAHAVVFTVRAAAGGGDTARIEAVDLRTGQRKTLLTRAQDAAYSEPGHLVFTVPGAMVTAEGTGGSLRAVRFDADRLVVTGDQVPVLTQMTAFPTTGAADYSLSRRGHLVYVPIDPRLSPQVHPRALVWVGRSGKEEPLGLPERSYATARISPDGTQIVVDIRDQGGDIWVWDVARKTLAPLNRDPAPDMSPMWTPDGRRIIWSSTRAGGNPNLYWQAADGSGSVERLTTNPANQFPTSIARDGSHLVVFGGTPSGMNLFTVALQSAEHKAEPLIQAPYTFLDGEISGDGHWLAYHSNESGDFQVFVRPYPGVDSGRVQISTAGGSRPAWAHNGHELFYLDASAHLMSVSVQVANGRLTAGPPLKILSTPYHAGFSTLGLDLRAYDVGPDDQRFLMVKDLAPTPQASESLPGLVVIANWSKELSARLPAK